MRMYHAGAEDFDPSRTLADGAALATAERTGNIDFHRRFREREVGRTETDLATFTEHAVRHELERSLEIRQRHMFANDQTFTLHELMRMGRIIVVAAVHLARADQLDRQLTVRRFELTHLNGCRMRTQQRIGINVEGILHIACRVVLRNVGKLKVVIILFHFRTFGNLVAHADEQILKLLLDHHQRMHRSVRALIASQRNVDLLFFQAFIELKDAQCLLTLVQSACDRLLAHIDLLAIGRLLFLGKLAHRIHQILDKALLAKIFDADVLEIFQISGSFDFPDCL